jgi:hypothetical protein
MQTLINAINGTGTYGLDNQVSFEHEQVSAVPTTQQGAVVVIARGAGTTGNNVALSTGGTTNLTVPATLTNGAGVINTPNSGQQLLAATVQYPFNVTAAQYAALVSNAINQNSGVSGFNALAKNQTVFLYSVGSNSFADNAVVTVTTTGQVAIGTCVFSFVQNKIGGGSVNSVSVDNNSLLPAAISLGSNTLAQLLVLVSNAINANTAASNELNLAGGFYAINAYFVALSIGNTLYISQIQTASTDAALAASATPDGTYITASSSNIPGFSASVPSSLSIAHDAAGLTTIPEVIAVCSATGGYPPYSYLWQDNARSPQISIVSGASSNTVIIQNTYLSVGFIQGFTCTVTDSLGNKAVSNLLSITTV